MRHTRSTLVVVGHGMVGHRFVQAAIERGLTETHDIVVIGAERRPAYDRVALTSFFAAESADELSLLGVAPRRWRPPRSSRRSRPGGSEPCGVWWPASRTSVSTRPPRA